MLYVDAPKINDPRINLAIEEHLLRNVQVDDSILLFYINEPAVIMGRNQNSQQEIDPDYIREQGIHVVRRLSGGGAVFHDLGNLNFSFITPSRAGLHDFARFTGPVIQVLRALGIDAELREKSAIFANDKKVSGNAQYAASGRMFSHGTLLFDTDVSMMLQALNPRKAVIESKAVQSVRRFVTNLKDLLDPSYDIYKLKADIVAAVFEGSQPERYLLDEEDWQAINQLSRDKYQSWDWNYGRSPKFNLQKSAQTEAGKLDVRIDVAKGVIQGVKIYGDFIGPYLVSELEEQLVGLRHQREYLEETLDQIDLSRYFGGLRKEVLLQLLY